MSRRLVLWVTLILIWLLIGLSIVEAFAGAERAQTLFNSIPIALVWPALGLALIVGITACPALVRRGGLLLCHVGCVLILAGAIWGSAAGHNLQRRLWGDTRVRRADMEILEGTREDNVRLSDGAIVSLPFSLGLEEFRIDYYPGSLQVQMPNGQALRLPAEPGHARDLGPGLGRVQVVRTFENFRISLDPNNRTAYDDPHAGSNPAVEVQITKPDGSTQRQYVFERFPQPHPGETSLGLSYRRMIKDYVSRVEVLVQGQVVARRAIEVNHPLHYGGYSFYQSSYGTDSETGKPVTVLTVVCGCGLSIVYGGFVVLIGGLFWHFWGGPALWRHRPGSIGKGARNGD